MKRRSNSIDVKSVLDKIGKNLQNGETPLHKLEIEEINEIARAVGMTYGKFVGYVKEFGKIPGVLS